MLTMKWLMVQNNSIVNWITKELAYEKVRMQPKWSDIDMADHFLGESHFYVKEEGKSEKPFFPVLCNAAATNVPRNSTILDLWHFRNGT